MGRGIAYAAALGGYRTILEDLLPGALRKAETEIRSNLDKAVELKKVTAADAEAAFKRLEYAGSVEEAARQADLVIEAVPEEMESKIEIFTLLDKICRPTTILASNTSSLSVTEIASVTYRAKKCIGMHFFNPVHKMKLLEVASTNIRKLPRKCSDKLSHLANPAAQNSIRKVVELLPPPLPCSRPAPESFRPSPPA